MHINLANIKFREFPILAKFNGRENLCSLKLMSAKINVLKVVAGHVGREPDQNGRSTLLSLFLGTPPSGH